MTGAYFEQIQNMIAEEVEESLLILDTQPGISEETRLNFAVDLAVASAYKCAIGDAIDALRAAGYSEAAVLLERDVLTRVPATGDVS